MCKCKIIPTHRVEEAVNAICRMWKEVSTDDPWHKFEYRQGLRDALAAMRRYKVIRDFSLDGVIMPTPEEIKSNELFLSIDKNEYSARLKEG